MFLQVALTPSEGKRIIGKAIAQMEVVQNALKEADSTNAGSEASCGGSDEA